MAELSRRSGVSVPTVKFYLREGLLPPGRATGATRAAYDESHVDRLRLIRALVEVGGLGLDRVRDLLAAVDRPRPGPRAVAHAVGAAHVRLSPAPAVPPSEGSRERVARLLAEHGLVTEADGRHATALAAALDAAERAGHPLSEAQLAVYVGAARRVAEVDVAGLPDTDPVAAATYAVLGTLVTEPVLLALRRLAQEDRSRRGVAGFETRASAHSSTSDSGTGAAGFETRASARSSTTDSAG